MRPAIAEQLRARGIDTITTAEAGRASQVLLDEDQLTVATADQRILITEDGDFARLAAIRQPHAGIVYFPIQLSIGACIAYLALLALTTQPDELRNQLLYGIW